MPCLMNLESQPRKILLAAISENGCIGANGKIPWHCSEDLKRFKQQTLGHALLMGRRTYESLGKPLPGRKNIVLTRDWTSPLLCTNHPDLLFCHDLLAALHCAKLTLRVECLFVVGGADVYRQSIPYIHEMRITKIPGTYPGDTFFPEWPLSDEWVEVHKEPGGLDANVEYVTYRRTNDPGHST